jgi:hypothetical protein
MTSSPYWSICSKERMTQIPREVVQPEVTHKPTPSKIKLRTPPQEQVEQVEVEQEE